jgi:hypothetical protein
MSDMPPPLAGYFALMDSGAASSAASTAARSPLHTASVMLTGAADA